MSRGLSWLAVIALVAVIALAAAIAYYYVLKPSQAPQPPVEAPPQQPPSNVTAPPTPEPWGFKVRVLYVNADYWIPLAPPDVSSYEAENRPIYVWYWVSPGGYKNITDWLYFLGGRDRTTGLIKMELREGVAWEGSRSAYGMAGDLAVEPPMRLNISIWRRLTFWALYPYTTTNPNYPRLHDLQLGHPTLGISEVGHLAWTKAYSLIPADNWCYYDYDLIEEGVSARSALEGIALYPGVTHAIKLDNGSCVSWEAYTDCIQLWAKPGEYNVIEVEALFNGAENVTALIPLWVKLDNFTLYLWGPAPEAARPGFQSGWGPRTELWNVSEAWMKFLFPGERGKVWYLIPARWRPGKRLNATFTFAVLRPSQLEEWRRASYGLRAEAAADRIPEVYAGQFPTLYPHLDRVTLVDLVRVEDGYGWRKDWGQPLEIPRLIEVAGLDLGDEDLWICLLKGDLGDYVEAVALFVHSPYYFTVNMSHKVAVKAPLSTFRVESLDELAEVYAKRFNATVNAVKVRLDDFYIRATPLPPGPYTVLELKTPRLFRYASRYDKAGVFLLLKHRDGFYVYAGCDREPIIEKAP